MYYEICISFYRKSFKSAKSRHFEDFKLVRQVFIIQKIIPGDMISYRKKVLVNFFSEQTLPFYDTQQADNSSGNRYAEASPVKKNIWIFPFIVWSTFSFKKMN